MSYWHVCPYCGAYLDPGERCDCRQSEQPAARRSADNEEGEKKDSKQQEGRK